MHSLETPSCPSSSPQPFWPSPSKTTATFRSVLICTFNYLAVGSTPARPLPGAPITPPPPRRQQKEHFLRPIVRAIPRLSRQMCTITSIFSISSRAAPLLTTPPTRRGAASLVRTIYCLQDKKIRNLLKWAIAPCQKLLQRARRYGPAVGRLLNRICKGGGVDDGFATQLENDEPFYFTQMDPQDGLPRDDGALKDLLSKAVSKHAVRGVGSSVFAPRGLDGDEFNFFSSFCFDTPYVSAKCRLCRFFCAYLLTVSALLL
jgi:hypothetical protein